MHACRRRITSSTSLILPSPLQRTQKQLYAAVQKVTQLREDVARQQAMVDRTKYTLNLEESINAQVTCRLHE